MEMIVGIVSILISLIALFVSIRSSKISREIARKQLEFAEQTEKKREEKERLAEQKRIQEKHQEELDWQEAAKRAHESPFPISEGTIKDRIDNEFRKIRSERILQRRC